MDRELLLQEILRLPWRTVLARPLVVRQDQPRLLAGSALVCALTARGPWNGRVVISCDRELVEAIARRLHGNSTVHANVQAIHWLTSTLAGLLRRVVAPDIGLGFPLVVDHEPDWSQLEPAVLLHFSSGSCGLSFALYGSEAAGNIAPDEGSSTESPANSDGGRTAGPFAPVIPLTGT